jgi:hypothetical protein
MFLVQVGRNTGCPHTALHAGLFDFIQTQRVNPFLHDQFIVSLDRAQLTAKLCPEKYIGSVRSQPHVFAHADELRAGNIVQCDFVAKQPGDLDNLFVRNLFACRMQNDRTITLQMDNVNNTQKLPPNVGMWAHIHAYTNNCIK